MEACSGARHLARALIPLGHTPKLMAPKFVSPYRMQGARAIINANDAAAISEAVTRPKMHFVPIKSTDTQAMLTVHRVRSGFVEERTATNNRVRGLLSEFGIILPLSADTVRRRARAACDQLPACGQAAVGDLLDHIVTLDQRIDEYDIHLKQLAHTDERNERLMQLRGVGPMTATALLSSIGNGSRLNMTVFSLAGRLFIMGKLTTKQKRTNSPKNLS
jgi:transposase